ncbi:putative ankyrin repeat protein [Chloropicon roscoffensis]|uniref:Ankyrin repeat protein n=1 Tax=Chloropicon roscoffensis TaxID=1461544 RepID=A0AAX4PB95_9CHLO
MVSTKRRRGEGTDTKPALVIALRQENEELREENEELREERARSREEIKRLKLKIAKFEAGCQAPQEKEKEVKLPTEVWAIVAGKLDPNDVCSFALVSKQLREAQVLAGRKLVTRPVFPVWDRDEFLDASFTQDWCAYWSRKFDVHQTDPEVVKHVLYVAARHGYLQVFEKYWSQGPQEKLSKLWDERTCSWAAYGGQLEVMKWLRAKGCPWGEVTSNWAAEGGHLELLQWMQDQDPPCPWNSSVCYNAARKGHLDVLRWARSQGCPWDDGLTCVAAKNGHLEVLRWARSQGCPWNDDVTWAAAWNGHLEVLRWARSQGCPWHEDVTYAAANIGHLKILKWLIKEGCPYDKSKCRRAAVEGGERARNVLDWLKE